MKKFKAFLIPFSVAFFVSFGIKFSSLNLSSALNYLFFIFPLFILLFIVLAKYKRNPILLKTFWAVAIIQNFFYSIMAYESFKNESYLIFTYFLISVVISLPILYFSEKFKGDQNELSA